MVGMKKKKMTEKTEYEKEYRIRIINSEHVIVEWNDGSASYYKSLFNATESIKRDYKEK